jgi:hypothetical protein
VKDSKIYKMFTFLTGDIKSLRTDIDDYAMTSSEYAHVYMPLLKKGSSSDEFQNEMNSIMKEMDTFRNEAYSSHLERIETLLEEVDEETIVDLGYLEANGIEYKMFDDGEWGLKFLCNDMVTGRKAYKLVYSIPFKKYNRIMYMGRKNTHQTKRMDYELFKELSPYIEEFKERNDNFDPIGEVESGTFYTFNKEEVNKILKAQRI